MLHTDINYVLAQARSYVNMFDFLSCSFKSFFSVKNYLFGVNTWSHILNFNIETFSSSELKLTLIGINNCYKHVQLIDIYDLLDACLWSFMTMAFFGGMLRTSNLLSRTPSCFNPTEQLIRRCVIFTKEGLLLRLLWSKTRQGHDYIHELPM